MPEAHWSEDPYQLITEIARVKDAHSHERSESKSLLQLYHQRPESSPETLVGGIINFTGLKKLGQNIMAEALDAAVSRLAKPVKTQLVSVGGEQKTRLGVIAANRLITGLHAENKISQVVTALLYDACLTANGKGYGLWQPDAEGNLRVYRMDPLETYITGDGMEATTTRFVSRRETLALYGGSEDVDAAIKAAPRGHPDSIAGVDSTSSHDVDDTIALSSGWILPAGKQKGRHVVQLDGNLVLVAKEWKHPVLPLFVVRASAGYRDGDARPTGRSIAPYAYWINSLTQKLWTQLQLQVPHLMVERGTVVTKPSDVACQVWEYDKGRDKPTLQLPQSVSEHIIAATDRLHDGALREAGLNEASSEGTVPGGITAGVAIRAYQTEVAIRLSQQSHNVNDAYVQSATILVHLAPEQYSSRPARVRADNTDVLEAIKWPGLKLPENSWSIIVQTSGALPETVAGKLETFGEFNKAAPDLIDGLDVAAAFDNPDLKAILEPKLAPRRLIEKQISACLDEDPPRVLPPDETQDAAYGTATTANHYQLARLKGSYPRKNVEALFRLHLLFKARTPGTAGPTLPAPSAAVGPALGAPPASNGAGMENITPAPISPLEPPPGPPLADALPM